ncbi:hypothetical protein Bca52824_026476 [Brassica carinata]|uniref:Uncharacterized protein n=1 Tax=Brassica carinata TaxID=52824 RepID=A0A8X7SGK2_BRACI|nr:hypothetical protein Bca52824_026476 [Brassica carinata]
MDSKSKSIPIWFLSSFKSFGTLKPTCSTSYGGGRIHQRWTGDAIGLYTAAEDSGGPSRSEAGVAIEPYGRVPFSQTQSLEPQSSKPHRN